jgi:hypothetical protein
VTKAMCSEAPTNSLDTLRALFGSAYPLSATTPAGQPSPFPARPTNSSGAICQSGHRSSGACHHFQHSFLSSRPSFWSCRWSWRGIGLPSAVDFSVQPGASAPLPRLSPRHLRCHGLSLSSPRSFRLSWPSLRLVSPRRSCEAHSLALSPPPGAIGWSRVVPATPLRRLDLGWGLAAD